MTTLQEAARKSFEAWKKTGSCFYLSRNNAPGSDLDGYQDAYTQGQWVAWQAALAQQGEQAKPAAYITDTEQGPMVWTPEMYDEACTYCDDGEFPVPLYTAAPAPQAQPMTDPCKTCSHFKEGNLPGVRIHDETCYECRSYWGNKWEAKSE